MSDFSGHIFRSPTLYPAELRARKSMNLILNSMIKGFPQHLKMLFGRDFSCLSNITKKLPDTEIKALVFVKFSGRY